MSGFSFFEKTPLEKKVLATTTDKLDWGVHSQLWDYVNRSRDAGQEFLKVLKKRITNKKAAVALLGLQLLESCVKNCRSKFHRQVEKEMLPTMAKVATAKKGDMKVQQMALSLIQQWALAFNQRIETGSPLKHPEFGALYDKLKAKGVMFPEAEKAAAPVFTPSASVVVSQSKAKAAKEASKSASPLARMGGPYVQKTMGDLRVVCQYMSVLRDMLTAPQATSASIASDATIHSLVRTLTEIRARLASLVVEISVADNANEELTDACIRVNNDVCSTLEWHKAATQGAMFTPQPLTAPPQLLGEAAAATAGGAKALGSHSSSMVAAMDEEKQDVAVEKGGKGGKGEEEEDDLFGALASSRAPPQKGEAAAAEKDPFAADPFAAEPLSSPAASAEAAGGAAGAAGDGEMSMAEFEDLLAFTDSGAGAAAGGVGASASAGPSKEEADLLALVS